MSCLRVNNTIYIFEFILRLYEQKDKDSSFILIHKEWTKTFTEKIFNVKVGYISIFNMTNIKHPKMLYHDKY